VIYIPQLCKKRYVTAEEKETKKRKTVKVLTAHHGKMEKACNGLLGLV